MEQSTPRPTVLTAEGPVLGLTIAGAAGSTAEQAPPSTTPAPPTAASAPEPGVPLHRFLGIPYAASPVGENRFRAPQPAPVHTEPLNAELFGPVPPQFGAPGAPAAHREGEDWLTLNIWTPHLPQAGHLPQAEHSGTPAQAPSPAQAPPQALLPVMVWIHGGAYVMGASAEPVYDGAEFARLGCVFVSLNYRLGMEGFAQFPDAPANRGLLDQAAALRWVRDNIVNFGGDPDNVTVFGESAGAGSILCHLSMPGSRDLFHRAILHSPPTMVVTRTLAEDVTAEFARVAAAAGLVPDTAGPVPDASGPVPDAATAASFARLSPTQCLDLMGRVVAGQQSRAPHWGRAVGFTPPLVPVVDGEVLPTDPWQAVRDGAGSGVDVIIGHNGNEFTLFMLDDPQPIDAERAARRVALMGPAEYPGNTGTPAVESYTSLLPGATAEKVFEAVQSDRVFTIAALDAAAGRAEATQQTGRTFVYFFDPEPAGGHGAPHAADVPLIFDRFDTDMGRRFYPEATAADHTLSLRMRRSWLAFATTGDPATAESGAWPEWTATSDSASNPAAAPTDAAGAVVRIWDYAPRNAEHPLLQRWRAFAADGARSLDLLD
ncbi:carboxylesterase family protein [Brevibacterium sp. 91QC2O2]|uniref:carboxylesterase/lipase family protein n=1 Tax=Brevibacterium TaxID=1696 RepID=UPI00211C4A04|nr:MULTISPECIES: carboxylesterase family protein [unclassified Brevibacterium]MCQ9369126.1 carboxylesterase family protein [Brevibacterium sp. 91QC2O2]MCQ9386483.1 carboxylesterase family protein [Brevibacterium sp. 68QC2CO]